MLYSYKGQYPAPLPSRIRLEDGSTRTPPYSEDVISSIGYRPVNNPPPFGVEQKLEWTGIDWLVSNKNERETQQDWDKVRDERDNKIREVEWRYNRYYRHQRLNLPQVDTIESLDEYVQKLADVTKQNNPYAIMWPSLNIVEPSDGN